MVELIQEFSPDVTADVGGRHFIARVYGAPQPSGPLWDGWLVFFPEDGGPPLVGDRETAQKRSDLLYWASGLEDVYLDGALQRVMEEQSRPSLFRHEPWGARAAHLIDEERIAYRLARQRLIDQGRAALSPAPVLEPEPGHA